MKFAWKSHFRNYINISQDQWVNTLRPRQNGWLFADVFECIFFNKNFWISNNISLKCVPQGLADNISSLVQIMAWRQIGDKPLSESMRSSTDTYTSLRLKELTHTGLKQTCVCMACNISKCIFVKLRISFFYIQFHSSLLILVQPTRSYCRLGDGLALNLNWDKFPH